MTDLGFSAPFKQKGHRMESE